MRVAPKITVVTVTLNDLEGLRRTRASVAGQNYSNIQHLVVDGASQDGSGEYCAAEAASDSRFSYISEPDNGIFDAMNKGARLADGDLIVFLNSSDLLSDDSVLSYVADHWVTNPGWLWGYGGIRYIDSTGEPVSATVQAPFNWRKLELGRQFIPHPASYISRALLLELGSFDEKFGAAADQEIFIRMSRRYPPAVWIRFLADFLMGGIHAQDSAWSRERLWHAMRVKNKVPLARLVAVDWAFAALMAAGNRTREVVGATVKKLRQPGH